MTIALFLIPYALFLLIYLFLSMFGITHLIRFGVQNFTTFIATFLYIAASVIILFLSFTILASINWSTPLLNNFSIHIPT